MPPRLGRFDDEAKETAASEGVFLFGRQVGFRVEPPVPPGEFLIVPAISFGGRRAVRPLKLMG